MIKLFFIGYIIMGIGMIPGIVYIKKDNLKLSYFWMGISGIGCFLMGFYIHLIWWAMFSFFCVIPIILFWFYWNEFSQLSDEDAKKHRADIRAGIKEVWIKWKNRKIA